MLVSHLFSRTTRRLTRAFSAALIATIVPQSVAGEPPSIDPPVPLGTGNFPLKVEPRVPVGKVLLFPITATDPEGSALTYLVTSSNPKVMVRARTGNPKLKVQIDHAAGGTGDPAFSGQLEFALFRDLTPQTVGYIGGFAQSQYYHNQIFHRIADLDPAEEPDGSFILQGGDPLGTGSGGPGFAFNNEFNPATIFSGRGQLAMANAGYGFSTYKGTNGSQFFITTGQPRFLDFNHTVFGQLLRGWETVEAIADTPRSNTDKPLVDIKLTSTAVEPNFSDAILLVSATAPGTSTITVQVTDAEGMTDSETFTVDAYVDTRNSPPFLKPIANQRVAQEKILSIPIGAVDLENDYTTFTNSVLGFPANGVSNQGGNPALVLGNAGYTGPLTLGVGVRKYDMAYRGTIDGSSPSDDDQYPIPVAVGDKAIEASAVNFGGAPAQALTNVVLATFRDADPTARPEDYTATVIWGDGSKESVNDGVFAATIVRDPSTPMPGVFQITGTHTYLQPGIYVATVELKATKGAYALLHSTGVISAGPVRAFGQTFKVKAGELVNGIVATITDDAPSAPSAYSARIHWGDGTFSNGTVERSRTGQLRVLGSHTYTDADDFAVTVEVTKTGAPGPAALAWSRAEVKGVKTPAHLPPFDNVNMIGQISGIAIPNSNQRRPILEKTGTKFFAALEFIALNAGTKPAKGVKVRFYLSEDKEVNVADVMGEDPNNPGTMIVVNPKDKPLMIGNLKEIKLNPLQSNSGVRYVFDRGANGDFRLKFPAGENGAGMNLLAHFVYTDPITDHLPVGRAVVSGPFEAFQVTPVTVSVKELGGAEESKKVFVALLRQPRAEVKINLTLDNNANAQITTSVTSLTFTPENWNLNQEILITAKDDNTTDGTRNVTVVLAPAISTDIRFNKLDPADVRVTVLDKTPTP